MAKNEAKIKFTAETGEFNDAIKQSNREMNELRAELKLNETQIKNTGATVETLEKQHSLLTSQLEASQNKTEALSQKLQRAIEIFGENSEEASRLRIQLTNAQTAEEKIKQAISKCNKELKNQASSTKNAESATKQLADEIDKQQTQVDQLKKEYSDAVITYGKTSKEAKELAEQIKKLSKELKENKDKAEDAEDAADNLDESLDEAGKKADSTNGKFSKLAAGAAALGAAMVAAGKEAIDAFNEVDEGADNAIKATGKTGQAASELEDTYKKVASSIVGDFGDIGSTLGEVDTRFGFTGKKAEEATIKFLKFSEITGVDSVDAVQSIARALNDAGIPLDEYDVLLDQLAKAGQTAGIDVTTLADSLAKNGSIMRSMGFDTQETIALLSQFELSGADASTMLTGMKKAMATWADQGKDGNVEFAKMIKGIKSGSISAADAIDVFGTKAGPMLVDAIKTGKFEYEDMLNVIQGSKGTLESTFDATVDGGYELELTMQNTKMAFAEAGGEIATGMIPICQWFTDDILPGITDGITAMVGGLSSAVTWMKEHEAATTAIGIALGVLTGAIVLYNATMAVKKAMDAAEVTTVWALVAAYWAKFTAMMAALGPYLLIVAAIAAVIAIIVVCIKYWDEIKAACAKAWEGIKNAWKGAANWFKGIWDGIKNAFANVGSWFSEKFNAAKQGVQNAWSGVKNFFSNIWSGIKNTFSNIGSWFGNVFNKAKEAILKPINAAKDKIKGIVDSIKGFFSKMKLSLPKIKLPHFKVEGKLSLSPPSVPKLKIDWYKDGGIMMKPTIFGMNGTSLMAGGEAGPEAILPIDRLQGYISGAIEKSVQTVNLQTLADAITKLANRPIRIGVNGREFAQVTASDNDIVNGQRTLFKSRGLELD